METGFMNKITGLVIALVVGGLLVGGLLIPTVQGMTATEKTFENEGYFKMTKYDSDSEITIEWSYAAPSKVKVNDSEFDLTGIGTGVTVAFAENAGLRVYWNLAGAQLMHPNGTMSATVANSDTLTLSIANQTITTTLTPQEGTSSMRTDAISTPIYCISEDGPYVMKKATTPAYMLDDSEFIGLGLSNITGGGSKTILVKGSITDGATATIVTTTGATVTLSTPEIDYNEVVGVKNTYELDKITFIASVSGSNDTPLTYNYFVVPATITAELSQHMDATQIAMFGVISILGIVALVVVAANGIRNKY